MTNPSYMPVSVPSYNTPTIDPLTQAGLNASNSLNSQESLDQISTTNSQAETQQLTTENTVREQMQTTLEGIANQAISLSQQFIGDEIAQEKKGLENAGKAV